MHLVYNWMKLAICVAQVRLTKVSERLRISVTQTNQQVT